MNTSMNRIMKKKAFGGERDLDLRFPSALLRLFHEDSFISAHPMDLQQLQQCLLLRNASLSERLQQLLEAEAAWEDQMDMEQQDIMRRAEGRSVRSSADI